MKYTAIYHFQNFKSLNKKLEQIIHYTPCIQNTQKIQTTLPALVFLEELQSKPAWTLSYLRKKKKNILPKDSCQLSFLSNIHFHHFDKMIVNMLYKTFACLFGTYSFSFSNSEHDTQYFSLTFSNNDDFYDYMIYW